MTPYLEDLDDSDGLVLISADEAPAQDSEDSDEDIVLPQRTTQPYRVATAEDDLISDIESDSEPINPCRRKTRPVLRRPANRHLTLNEEVAFLDQHYGHLRDSDHTPEGVQLRVNNFRIYKRGTEHLESLHKVAVHDNKARPQYSFAGTLVHEDGSTQEVAGIDIWHVAIDNLGGVEEDMRPSSASAANAIFLETVNSCDHNCFYLLGSPSAEYTEIYHKFQWLANLLKHITDFLTWAAMDDRSIKLQDFKALFSQKMNEWHGDVNEFQAWLAQCDNTVDFRQHLACPTNTKFIYYTIESIKEDQRDLLEHMLWEDLGLQARLDDPAICPRTLATKHIASCFLESFPHWGRNRLNLLEVIELKPAVHAIHKQRSTQLGLGDKSSTDQAQNFETHNGKKVSKAALILEQASSRSGRCNIRLTSLIGHAVVARQHSTKCEGFCSCDTYKLAVVLSASSREVRVRWLELPQSTMCAGRKPDKRQQEQQHPFYPIGNEVFLSDACCCASVSKDDILETLSISINENHALPGDELFVHRKWTRNDNSLSVFRNDEIAACPECTFSATETASESIVSSDERHMNIVSLFSGVGLLDHGFNEGSAGSFETTLVIELDCDAMMAYKNNTKGEHFCEYLVTDVNKPFRLFCTGLKPFPRFVILIAGNPCRGFSRRNGNKSSVNAQKFCTLLAHTLAWIDAFRPEMVLIENVVGMDETKPSALGQAICCLVSMGYQAKVVTIKASLYGAATNRERLFLMATAPGVPLPKIPDPTHGENRYLQPLTTTSAVTSDLGSIDNNTLLNPKVPYHVSLQRMAPDIVNIVSKIPRTSRGAKESMPNINSIVSKLTPEEKLYHSRLTNEQKKKGSGCLRRIHPNKPFRTITTGVSVTDARGPGVLHWSEDRIASLQEFRRFQGVPDSFIQVGSAAKQIRQIGNSVEYNMAKLLGRVCAESWRSRIDLKVDDSMDVQNQSETFKGMQIHELSDEDETTARDEILSPIVQRENTFKGVDIPPVSELRRRFRESLSLEPNRSHALRSRSPASLAEVNARYKRKINDILQHGGSAIWESTEETESSLSTSNASARNESETDDSDDGLPEPEVLLTPMRLRGETVSTGSKRKTPQTSKSLFSTPNTTFTVRRRRRSILDDDSEEEVSPSKRQKAKDVAAPGLSRNASLLSKYGFGTSSSSSQLSEGASPESAIVLDD